MSPKRGNVSYTAEQPNVTIGMSASKAANVSYTAEQPNVTTVMSMPSSIEMNVEGNNYKLEAMKTEYELKIKNLQVSFEVKYRHRHFECRKFLYK